MPNFAALFEQHCEDAARRFLQSVVVIDDQAELYENERGHGVGSGANLTESRARALRRRPVTGLSKEQTSQEIRPRSVRSNNASGKSDRAENEVRKSHLLRAWVLTKSLADKEILCAVYRPDDHQFDGAEVVGGGEKSVVLRSIGMAKLADIVVLDWELFDPTTGNRGSVIARDIVKGILEKDEEIRGRQRLIVIYTATPDLKAVYEDIVSDIGSGSFVGGALTKNSKKLLLYNRTTRIAFLNKDAENIESNLHTTVSESSLADRLIKEFVELNRGLLSTIVLHSIASVREATHQLVSTFGAHLDPALVGHRSLLPDPQDSEEFVVDLISGELRSTLSLNKIGEKYAGVDAHKEWIAGKLGDKEVFKLGKYVSVTKAEALELVTKGSSAFDSVQKAAALRWTDAVAAEGKKFEHKYFPGNISKKRMREFIENADPKEVRRQISKPELALFGFKQVAGLFAENQGEGAEIDREFSRLTALKRECHGARSLPEGWLPKLTLGSIIREMKTDASFCDDFLLCIQPRCDSVRIMGETPFPFLTMTKKRPLAATKQLLVVNARTNSASSPANIELWINPIPSRQEMLTFCPDRSFGDHIEAIIDQSTRVFKTTDGRQYEWIADMKDFLAQKICDQLSGRQSSIGLDEYEWLRRKTST